MRSTVIFSFIIVFGVSCGNVIGTPELPPSEELIQGTWQVFDVIVDGQNFPVTNPGAGQIQVTFEDYDVEYIYPELNENQLPTSNSDTLWGDWSFNDDESLVTIANFSEDEPSKTLEWEIVSLGIGLLHTRFYERSPTSPDDIITYEFIYRLSN